MTDNWKWKGLLNTFLCPIRMNSGPNLTQSGTQGKRCTPNVNKCSFCQRAPSETLVLPGVLGCSPVLPGVGLRYIPDCGRQKKLYGSSTREGSIMVKWQNRTCVVYIQLKPSQVRSVALQRVCKKQINVGLMWSCKRLSYQNFSICNPSLRGTELSFTLCSTKVGHPIQI